MSIKSIMLGLTSLILVACTGDVPSNFPILDLEAGSPREIAFTDKADAFWVTRSGGYNSSPWHGLTAKKRQYLEDLFIYADGELLDREQAQIQIDPAQLVRNYDELGIRETWSLVDEQRSLLVVIEANEATSWAVQPAVLGGSKPADFTIQPSDFDLKIRLNRLMGAISSYPYMNLHFSQPMTWETPVDPGLPLYNAFLTPRAEYNASHKLAILVSISESEEPTALDPNWVSLFFSDRRNRLLAQADAVSMQSDQPEFNSAIAWAHASLDALIMDQMGTGIYAGLPWFDDYWGRDVFISFTGAVLVSGKYEEARQILSAFAKFQNTDSLDKNYGRIPNRAQPQDIIYNTTDGTPWFIRSIWDYYRYSGDEAFFGKMWPTIKHATVGALKNWTDASGLLRHDDADTWMDAKGPDGPWSPRGDRAIEIQFIWRDQLEITRQLAFQQGDQALEDQCSAALTKLVKGLEAFRSDDGYLVDHLNRDNSQDVQIRPNVFLVAPLFDETCDWTTFQTLAPRLITHKGVLSLSQDDPNFHPYHQQPGLYVKDAAYHNGIIWTWNSAAVVGSAIHFHQYHYAQSLFEDLTNQIRQRGAVGTLAELTDAWPKDGVLGLSGTFSQAWSLAEYLRVYYQDILGVQPDLTQNLVTLAPRLFPEMESVAFKHPIGEDTWKIQYTRDDKSVEIHIERQGDDEIQLKVELLTGEQLSKASFSWNTADLHLRYEKQMGQWTVPASIIDYQLSTSPLDIPINSLAFCPVDTRIAVPALAGPKHRLLKKDEVIPLDVKMESIEFLKDDVGDDKGKAGRYTYPSNLQFEAGIADIKSVSIGESAADYHFQFEMVNLVDPGWHPEYGYQLTYIAMGFSFDGSTGSRQIGKNADTPFKDNFKADQCLYISGGLLLVDGALEPIAEYMPLNSSGALGSAQTNRINFRLPKSLFAGSLNAADIQIAVGVQDDHGGAGIGDFRAIEAERSEWAGGGRPETGGSNVYDWLTN